MRARAPDPNIVQIQFRETPMDLYVCGAYMVGTTIILLASGEGNPLAIPLVLFVPGYVLVSALFPGRDSIYWPEAIILSFGAGIVQLTLVGLALAFLPFGLRFTPTLAAINLVTFAAGLVAVSRRLRLAPEDRLSARLSIVLQPWKQYSALDKGLLLTLAASVALAAVSVALTNAGPRSREPFTEFYLRSAPGDGTYPAHLNISQDSEVILGIGNHENADSTYTVRVDMVSVGTVYNAGCSCNQTVELSRATWSFINVTLRVGDSWTQNYTFRIGASGYWSVQFLLFKDANLMTPYRLLRIFVVVT